MEIEPDGRRLILKVVLDLACVLALGIPVYIFYSIGTPYKRGFFCDDESLRHPYHGSTVGSLPLYMIGFCLPIGSIILLEFLQYFRSPDKQKIRLGKMKIPTWVWESYKHIGIFLFGVGCTMLLTNVGKYTIGRLRPHFFDACKPDINCTDEKYKYVYIEEFTCAETRSMILKDMRLSFPSGHSSFSVYTMLYLCMYLQAKLIWSGSKLLKHFIQFICFVMAFYCCLSRISDYKHHWSDVLSGAILGTVFAVFIILYVSNVFEKPKAKNEEEGEGIRMD